MTRQKGQWPGRLHSGRKIQRGNLVIFGQLQRQEGVPLYVHQVSPGIDRCCSPICFFPALE